jgi:FkbM family methyltransferase
MMKLSFRSFIEHFPNLALFLRAVRDQLDQWETPKMTPWGFTLAGNDAMANGTYETEETKLVRELAARVDIFVNIGANVGYYCCHALSLGKQVIAVEPIARNLHYLLKNISNNGWSSRAQVFPVALGRGTDILKIFGRGTGASLIKGWADIPQSYFTLVPVLSLDRILGGELQEKRALILVDIEGAEPMMLQGATQTLEHAPRPIWMVEICTTENQPTGTAINPNVWQTFEMFFSRGYRAWTADDQKAEVTSDLAKSIARYRREVQTQNFLFT